MGCKVPEIRCGPYQSYVEHLKRRRRGAELPRREQVWATIKLWTHVKKSTLCQPMLHLDFDQDSGGCSKWSEDKGVNPLSAEQVHNIRSGKAEATSG